MDLTDASGSKQRKLNNLMFLKELSNGTGGGGGVSGVNG
jgi:hypothetical protein